jgi:selenocysteine lyase/cysteine desulfurase
MDPENDDMDMTRRDWLAVAGALPLAGSVLADVPAPPTAPIVPRRPPGLPDKSAFAATDVAYLDSGSQHPISLGAKAAIDAYLAKRTLDPAAAGYELDDRGVLARFARLINADVDEVTFVQSTTAGEQMVLRSVGLPRAGARVVTDTLHFFGSVPLYEDLALQGVEVSWIQAQDGRIRLEDVRDAVRKGTDLVALSHVSTINGFEHDLKAVCEIAHAAGALVYADMIHAVGCVPVDVHASGVDFAACASYKWLMGDFGLGFLYVRKDVQHRLQRTNHGYYGINRFESHVYPLDPPGRTVADYSYFDNATGWFALGTHSHAVIAQLAHSLDYIEQLGVARIQAHAQTLVQRLKTELPALGYTLITPAEAPTPMVACALADARKVLAPRLQAAKVAITLSRNRFRVSVSVFNDDRDIDRLLAALGHA